MTVRGIDVSHYQLTTPPLAGLSFLFAKATEGTYFADPLYAVHTGFARGAGLVAGAYHFGVAGDGGAQARAFLAVAAGADLLALDLESSAAPMTTAQAAAFIVAVHAAGRKVGLYHSSSGFPNLGQDWDWVADWGTVPPPRPWTFWQFRGAPLDADLFDGDMASLWALAGRTDMTALGWKITAFEGGIVTVKGTGHDAVRLRDGVRLAQPAGLARPYAAKIALDVQLPGGIAGADRRTGFLIGEDVCILLASDVTAVPTAPPADTTPFSQADVDKAVAASIAAGLAKMAASIAAAIAADRAKARITWP